MNFWRRPEIWILAVLIAGGLGWVVHSQRAHRRSAEVTGTGLRDVHVIQATLSREGTHQRLRVEFTARHDAAEPLEVASPAVRLLDATGAEMPPFFAPGAFPPALAPGAPAASWMEFWLTDSQARAPLSLEVAGQRVPVPVSLPTAAGG